jgi:hypothetical protein
MGHILSPPYLLLQILVFDEQNMGGCMTPMQNGSPLLHWQAQGRKRDKGGCRTPIQNNLPLLHEQAQGRKGDAGKAVDGKGKHGKGLPEEGSGDDDEGTGAALEAEGSKGMTLKEAGPKKQGSPKKVAAKNRLVTLVASSSAPDPVFRLPSSALLLNRSWALR